VPSWQKLIQATKTQRHKEGKLRAFVPSWQKISP
jgi:hypothetical protein